MVKRQNELWSGAQRWGYRTDGLNELCLVGQSSSVETEGKRLLNLQGHCSPRKAVPLETALYWEEQGAEEGGWGMEHSFYPAALCPY